MCQFVASTMAPYLEADVIEETREDANKIRIRMVDLQHTNLYVITHMYLFVASLFYSIPLLALTHRQTDRQTEE